MAPPRETTLQDLSSIQRYLSILLLNTREESLLLPLPITQAFFPFPTSTRNTFLFDHIRLSVDFGWVPPCSVFSGVVTFNTNT